ncbi:iron chelate uptake ABC transporter family permease subunit [Frankia sp. AgPm24]|uniref:FecCD family ABC transporter permease n=1 Tax=Frankia sp. AgPm24 TaxID=631128 RepID=UPI00200C59BF|nr:iron chelate uptake ABC transporter family permease subunit [Frankia sp. AgPm24]MCK9923695.1 iron chelate uptake ABC transporter family permease subunit [Frankia sp. AgPm24]
MSGGQLLGVASGRIALRVRPRTLTVSTILAVGVLVLGVWTLMTGDYPASPGEVVRSLVGHGPPGLEVIVNRFRLPRLLIAIAVGAALGVAGGIFQSISANPLGSPDIIGLTTGSATGALAVILVFPHAAVGVPVGALLGGLVTAALVYLLALRDGSLGSRLVLVGIGVTAILESVNGYLLSRASLADAQAAQLWIVGSLNGRGWSYAWPVWAACGVLVPVALVLGRPLAILEQGDDTAAALGVPVRRTRLSLFGCGVALTTTATVAAGPIAFVALAAPQIARRLVRRATPSLGSAALTGSLIMVAADFAGQHLFGRTQLPVGLATGAIGGVYLLWLLSREWRTR